MSKLSLGVAKKLRQLLQGEKLAHSQLRGAVVKQMIDEGVLQQQLQGRSRKIIFASKVEVVRHYLVNHFGVNDLDAYISNFDEGQTRAENVLVSGDSKLRVRRTFKGFLVNCILPIAASINGEDFNIYPQEGVYTYIHDFESFTLPKDVLVIGVENPENFRYLAEQQYLFGSSSLFVCRYPQSKDLVAWLQSIPNRYLHFGDFDFEGIRIFRDEYLSYLGAKATFFIPPDLDSIIHKYGNKELYDKQYRADDALDLCEEMAALIRLFHKHKKCLEQEVLIQL